MTRRLCASHSVSSCRHLPEVLGQDDVVPAVEVSGRHRERDGPEQVVRTGVRVAPAADEAVQAVDVQVSVPGCRSTQSVASVDFPIPGGPFRCRSRTTARP